MSGRYFVIDIGSRNIKGAVCDVRKKEFTVIDTIAVKKPLLKIEYSSAIKNILEKLGGKSSQNIIISIGDGVYLRNMTFPFSERSKIDPLVLYEFGDQLPEEIDDLTTTWTINPKGQSSESIVLCAATSSDNVVQMINNINTLGGDVCRFVMSGARAMTFGIPGDNYAAVIDFGAGLTEISILHGDTVVMSRIIYSGVEDIIDSLASFTGQDVDVIRNWIITSGGVSMEHPDEEEFEKIIRNELVKQTEEWRKFIGISEKELGLTIGDIVLTGGGSALQGLLPFVSNVTGKKVTHASIPNVIMPQEWISTIALVSTATKYSSDMCDFRRGGLARGASFSLVKDRALMVMMSLMLFFGSLVVSGVVSLNNLERQEKDLLGLSALLSREVLGKKFMDPGSINRSIKKKFKKGKKGIDKSESPIPRMSAYTVLGLISSNLPPAKPLKKDGEKATEEKPDEKEKTSPPSDKKSDEKAKKPSDSKPEVVDEKLKEIALDITKIHIKTGKISITGTVERAQDVDEISKGLKRIECFQEIRQGKMKTVGSGENEKREFTLDITMNCL
ncbi:MAG: hypothetical protein JXR95_08715 [Deltaproteobacteria bacterium]|nr:hypothetical protein [Deltaproteobacteria bacterium]